MIKSIWNLLKGVWNALKKIVIKIFNFFINLKIWFKSRFNGIRKNHPNSTPISILIKKNIKNKDYNTIDFGLSEEKNHIVNTFYDENTGKILTEETEVISSESLDEETKKAFGDKDMLVLK